MTENSVKRDVENRKAGARGGSDCDVFPVLRLHTIQARPARTGGLGAEPPRLCVLGCNRFQVFN